ncbi:MAG TPA: YihY/virulence factor BrkB family protein [Bacteroidales bacterium]|nr:YihY/virulence factor BrkB family protein [Bacteroidales bacterium]
MKLRELQRKSELLWSKYLNRYKWQKERFNALLSRVRLPGFGGITLQQVLSLYIRGLFKGAVSLRASAVAFNFFLAIFPFILFLFTLIPYVPVKNFQDSLFEMLAGVIPPEAFTMVESIIYDIINKQNSGLLSLSFILTFFFSTNGISAIIDGFNTSLHTTETRNWFQQRIISFMLVIVLSMMLIVSIALLTTGGYVLDYLIKEGWITGDLTIWALFAVKWLVSVSLVFFSTSILYYYAPAKRKNFYFFSPGAILATLLLVFGTLGFNYYIANFSRYNALYGSIGTLIILLMWIFFNAYILLIGYELNASIMRAGHSLQESTRDEI